jgi:hypothetical protein
MHSQPENIAVAQPRRLGLRPRRGALTGQQPGGPGSAAANAAHNTSADTSPDHLLLWGLRTYNSGTRRRPLTGITALMAAWQNSSAELSMLHIVTCAECGSCLLPSAHAELKQWSRQEVPPGSVPTYLPANPMHHGIMTTVDGDWLLCTLLFALCTGVYWRGLCSSQHGLLGCQASCAKPCTCSPSQLEPQRSSTRCQRVHGLQAASGVERCVQSAVQMVPRRGRAAQSSQDLHSRVPNVTLQPQRWLHSAPRPKRRLLYSSRCTRIQ